MKKIDLLRLLNVKRWKQVGIDLKVSSHVIGEVSTGPTITSNYGLSSSGTTRQSKEANYKVWSQWLPDRAADIKLWMDW